MTQTLIKNKTIRKQRRSRLDFSTQVLKNLFHIPLKEAAQNLGVCEAVLKRICRRQGIPKWPFRKINAIQRDIDQINATISRLKENLTHDSSEISYKIQVLHEKMNSLEISKRKITDFHVKSKEISMEHVEVIHENITSTKVFERTITNDEKTLYNPEYQSINNPEYQENHPEHEKNDHENQKQENQLEEKKVIESGDKLMSLIHAGMYLNHPVLKAITVDDYQAPKNHSSTSSSFYHVQSTPFLNVMKKNPQSILRKDVVSLPQISLSKKIKVMNATGRTLNMYSIPPFLPKAPMKIPLPDINQMNLLQNNYYHNTTS